MEKIRKGDFVTYLANGRKFRALIETVHRDRSVTVKAYHVLDPRDQPEGCFLGFRYRMDVNDVRKAV